jgi:hypothetical protein
MDTMMPTHSPFTHKPKLTKIADSALNIATMAFSLCVRTDAAEEVLKVDDSKFFIVTTSECNQVQAVAVYYQHQPQKHSKVGIVFKGALAGSDAEATMKESKTVGMESLHWVHVHR